MNSALLEVEKLLTELKDNLAVSEAAIEEEEQEDEWDRGYARGTAVAYEDAYEQCKELHATLTTIYQGTNE